MNESQNDAQGIFSPFAQSALLVVPRFSGQADNETRSEMAELESLVDTMGLEVAGGVIAPVKIPKPRFFFGSGKAEEIAEMADELEVDCIIFDEDLSPASSGTGRPLLPAVL